MSLSFLKRDPNKGYDDSSEPIPYEHFNSGISFEAARAELRVEQRFAHQRAHVGLGDYMFVSRRTVLGRMKEIKEREYARYLEGWERRHDDNGRHGLGFLTRRQAMAEGLPF